MEANASHGLNVVMLPPGTYSITLADGAVDDPGESGAELGGTAEDLDIRGRLVLIGSGSSSTILEGDGHFLDILAPTYISGVTIRDRTAGFGTAIRAAATLTGNDVVGADGGLSPPPGDQAEFICTQVIGYSSTSAWFPAAEALLDDIRWQLLYQNGGAAIRWGDPTYLGWNNPPESPCAENSHTPDRIIMDVAPDSFTQNVSELEADIRRVVSTIRRKYPAVREIVLQPEQGGPHQAACPSSQTPYGVVRATYSHAAFDVAIARVVGGDIVRGPDPQVEKCADFADGVGHLTVDGAAALGRKIGHFYGMERTASAAQDAVPLVEAAFQARPR